MRGTGCEIQGAGCEGRRVWGCRVWGAGVSLQGLRYAVCKAEGMYKGCEDADCRVYGTGCMAQGVGCERSMKFWNFSVSLCRFRVFHTSPT